MIYLFIITVEKIIMPSTIDQIKAFFPLETWEKNEILRTKCEKVEVFDDEIRDFCDVLVDLMYAYDWCWLAAPQIWQNIRIIATTQRKEVKKWNKSKREIIWEMPMVNPEILEHSEIMKPWEEACLSVPWVCWDVERWTRVVVRYQDKKWKLHTQKFTWFSAVVIQHEMDHLEWILFSDKVIWDLRKIEN